MSDIYSGVLTPFKFAYGCIVSVESSSGINYPFIFPGSVRDDTNAMTITVPSTIQLYGDLNGTNGLDVGSLVPNKVYAVFAIGDPTGRLPSAGLISLSQVAPVMPTTNGITYGAKRLIGYVRTEDSMPAEFSKSFTTGNGLSRTMYYYQRDTANIVYSFSAASDRTDHVDMSSCLPNIDPEFPNPIALLTFNINGGNNGDKLYISSDGSSTGSVTNSTLYINICLDNEAQSYGQFEVPIVPSSSTVRSPTFSFGLSISAPITGDVNVVGFRYDI